MSDAGHVPDAPEAPDENADAQAQREGRDAPKTVPENRDGPDETDDSPDETHDAPDKGPAIIGYIACALIPVGFFLGPLATWLVWRMRRDNAFVDFHGRQALDLTGAGIVAAAAVWLFLRLAFEVLVPRGFGAFMANLEMLQFIVVALYVGLLIWGAVAAARGQLRVLPLGLPWLRARAKNQPGLEDAHGS